MSTPSRVPNEGVKLSELTKLEVDDGEPHSAAGVIKQRPKTAAEASNNPQKVPSTNPPSHPSSHRSINKRFDTPRPKFSKFQRSTAKKYDGKPKDLHPRMKPVGHFDTPRPKSTKGSTFGRERKRVAEPLKPQGTVTTPGPGAYHTPAKLKTVSMTIPKSAKKVASSAVSPTGIPGPGEYNLPSNTSKTAIGPFSRSAKPVSSPVAKSSTLGPGYYLLKPTKPKQGASFAHAEKSTTSTVAKPINVTPGPGAYDQQTDEEARQKKLRALKANKALTNRSHFGTANKATSERMSKPTGIPGPGTYDIEKHQTSHVGATTFGRGVKSVSTPLRKSNTPGPGEYQFSTPQKKIKSISFSKAKKEVSDVPEPASQAYCDPGMYYDVIGSSPRFMATGGTIARSAKKVASFPKSTTPGPGHYRIPETKRKEHSFFKERKLTSEPINKNPIKTRGDKRKRPAVAPVWQTPKKEAVPMKDEDIVMDVRLPEPRAAGVGVVGADGEADGIKVEGSETGGIKVEGSETGSSDVVMEIVSALPKDSQSPNMAGKPLAAVFDNLENAHPNFEEARSGGEEGEMKNVESVDSGMRSPKKKKQKSAVPSAGGSNLLV